MLKLITLFYFALFIFIVQNLQAQEKIKLKSSNGIILLNGLPFPKDTSLFLINSKYFAGHYNSKTNEFTIYKQLSIDKQLQENSFLNFDSLAIKIDNNEIKNKNLDCTTKFQIVNKKKYLRKVRINNFYLNNTSEISDVLSFCENLFRLLL